MVTTERLNPTQVLVIDDDPSAGRMTELTLTQGGYQATVCTDSTKAMELLKDGSYGCVLLDIRMKGLEGTELLPIIKRNSPSLPVVLVSAYCDGKDASYYNSLGAFDFVSKPFSSDRLLDVVGRAVGVQETIPLVLTSLALSEARDQVFRKVIVTALRKSNWNQTKAAQLLRVSRHSLIRWLQKLKITY